ncbi:MAG TPA: cyclic nucleotide-binding domain-containing protein, partial [Gaiellaceae bacterium]|nr:cyclic nucleotide-binding domain-containing protein [Gaiellaceae bacterium]
MIELDKLRRVPVFADLPPERLQWLCDNLTGFTVEAGDVLLEEGEISSSLFILLDGEVTATRRAEGHLPSERFVAPEILGTPCVIASIP